MSDQDNYRSSEYFFNMEALLCPCILLGNIQSKLHREDPSISCSRCPECELGPHGFQSCAYTCFLSACGWPVSPCLSMHLFQTRKKFQVLYEYDDRLKPPTTFLRQFKLCCCWCINLQEQYQFVQHLWNDKQLTYHWDFDLYRDQLKQRRSYSSQTVLMFAPPNFATTTFMNKFSRHTSIPANVAATSASSKHLHRFLSPEMIDLEHVEQIETGVKTHMHSNGEVTFLEVWKIPPNKFHSQVLAKSIPAALVSYYIFDLADIDSIDKLKRAYTEHGYFATGKRMAIVLNEQQLSPDVPPSKSQLKNPIVFSGNEEGGEQEESNIAIASPRNDDQEESHEKVSLVSPRLKSKSIKELQNWARQHSIMLYEVSLNKQDDMAQLIKILSEALEANE